MQINQYLSKEKLRGCGLGLVADTAILAIGRPKFEGDATNLKTYSGSSSHPQNLLVDLLTDNTKNQ